ncbi:MAG: RNA pseudouridine synthase [Bacteroidetes bacterium]|nr:RNA pseudouridine synthase [Bacteroidota bacterium]
MTLPERFTFPFYYEPHPLTKIAATELQNYLETEANLEHNFGLSDDTTTMVIGKMFGVLVVADTEGKIGYLSAFSGKLAGTNDHPKFVPPVFDMLTENSFFLQEQEVIDAINRQLEELLSDENYIQQKQTLEQLSTQSTQEIAAFKQQIKVNKEMRGQRREENKNNPDAKDAAIVEAELAKASHYDRHMLRVLKADWKERLENIQANVTAIESRIEALKNERKERSAALQDQLFEQYVFLNKAGEHKSLLDIFKPTAFGIPPSGAGECATPKLLQYAFANGYKPLAMAEFWWGASPKSEIRKHKQFYPACTGKCKPILAHMLEGIPIDDNPFLQPAKESIRLEIIHEDEYLLVVNKPSGLRSVPGIGIDDSVYSRLKSVMENIEPLIVHRLDMGTSGLLVVAKAPDVHKHLQRQFLERKVSKRYTALLSKAIDGEGEIDLPLTLDPFNRPMQLVCFDTGKNSVTKWKACERIGDTTKVHFWPLTGRTHQLRVHSAHELGLNAPIVGDDLYGTADKRLYLHAAYLEFMHPKTKQRMSFEIEEDF